MKIPHVVVVGIVSVWGLLPGVWHTYGRAQAGEPASQHERQVAMGERNAPVDPHAQHKAMRTRGNCADFAERSRHEESPLLRVQMGGHHHHHRPPVLPPEEDKAYSELNHHVAGVFVVCAGGLALLATVAGPRYAWARYGWPGLFFVLGVFLLVRPDPESWPLGPLTFWESVTDAQVLQHMLFSLIVFAIGVIEWLRSRGTLTHPAWGWIFPSLAISAALMLFLHKHGEGPVADKIYRHHAIMAVSGTIAMMAKVFDDARLFESKIGAYVWTGLMMFVGVMLLIYTE